MTLRLFVGFVTASLIQLVFIVITEGTGLSSLNPGFSSTQLVLHFVIGQAFGWAFYYVWRRTAAARAWNVIWSGVIYGLIAWLVVMPLATSQGLITSAWSHGANLVVTSTSFVLYGMFVAIVASSTWRLMAR